MPQESIKDYDVIYITVPPDGGYGWFIVVTTFFIQFILDSIACTFGLFLVPMDEDLVVGAAKVALSGSLLNGFYYLSGPVSSGLAGQFGFRTVSIVGSILASFGLFASAFLPSIELIWISYGVIAGIGFGLAYIPAIVMVGLYFEKWRALATSISSVGSGIGLIVLSPLYAYLLRTLHWRRTMMIQAGLALICVVLGFTLRPVPPKKVRIPRTMVAIQAAIKQKGTPSVADVLGDEMLEQIGEEEITEEDTDVKAHHFYRDDIFYTGSLLRLDEYESKKTRGAFSIYHLKVNRFPHWKVGRKVKRIFCPAAMKAIIKSMVDMSLLLSTTFMVQAVSGTLFSFGYFVPLMYVTGRGTSNGMTKERADFLITLFGASNVVARLLCGIVASVPGANPLQIRNLGVIIGGIFTCISMLNYSVAFQFSYVIVFGITVALFSTLRSIILVDSMGLEKLNNGFGLLLLFQGIGVMIGTPLAGAMADWTGNYDISFWYAGGLIVLSGIIMLPLSCIANREKSRKRRL